MCCRRSSAYRSDAASSQAARVTPNQVLKSYSYSLNTCDAASEALEAACEPHGGETPDAVFLCAGAATPGFFVEQTEESMKKGMDNTYWLAAWSAMVCSPFSIVAVKHVVLNSSRLHPSVWFARDRRARLSSFLLFSGTCLCSGIPHMPLESMPSEVRHKRHILFVVADIRRRIRPRRKLAPRATPLLHFSSYLFPCNHLQPRLPGREQDEAEAFAGN